MSDEVKLCPVCKLGDQKVLIDKVSFDGTTYDCFRCGRYSISRTAEAVLSRNDKSSQLSGWLREQNLLGIEITMLTSIFLEELLKTLPNYSPLEKQNKLLRAIESLTKYLGYVVVLESKFTYSFAWAENEKEFNYYVRSLLNRDLIDAVPGSRSGPLTNHVVITAEGWEYLERQKSDVASKTQAFVAMSFDPELKFIYENAIAKAVEST